MRTPTLPFRSRLAASAVSLLLAASATAATATIVAAQDDVLDAQGQALVEEFIEILSRDDTEKATGLEAFLGPEFQILRGNGVRYDKAGYIENPSSVIEVEIAEVRTTGGDGVLVVTYTLSADVVIDDVETTTVAPRMTVFHEDDAGDWHLAAHANFNAFEDEDSMDG